MSERQDRRLAERRGFLKLASLGAVAGGAALVVKGGDKALASDAKPDGQSGYRETDHVKTFYATARF